MKKSCLLLLIIVLFSACEQPEKTEQVITGYVQNLWEGDRVVLAMIDPTALNPLSPDALIVLDSTEVTQQNRFTLSTKEKGVDVYLFRIEIGSHKVPLTLAAHRYSRFFLDDYADIHLSGQAEQWKRLTVRGGIYSHPDLRKIKQVGDHLLRLYERRNQLYVQKTLHEKITTYNREFMSKHPGKTYSAWLLLTDEEYRQDIDLFEKVFLTFTPEVQASHTGREARFYIEKIRTTYPGAVAPDFDLPSTTGERVKLSGFRGKYVILNFLTSGIFDEAGEDLIRFYDEIKDNEDIVMINILTGTASYPWLQLQDEAQQNGKTVSETYFLAAPPLTILISPDGIIQLRENYYKHIVKSLREALHLPEIPSGIPSYFLQ